MDCEYRTIKEIILSDRNGEDVGTEDYYYDYDKSFDIEIYLEHKKILK